MTVRQHDPDDRCPCVSCRDASQYRAGYEQCRADELGKWTRAFSGTVRVMSHAQIAVLLGGKGEP